MRNTQLQNHKTECSIIYVNTNLSQIIVDTIFSIQFLYKLHSYLP